MKTNKAADSATKNAKKNHVPPAEPQHGKRGSLGKWLVLLLVLAASAAAAFFWLRPPADNRIIDEIHLAYKQEKYQEVLDRAERLVKRKTENSSVLLKAAKSAEALKRDEDALRFLDLIDDEQGVASLDARTMSGDIAFRLGRARDAERYYRSALAIVPTSEEPNRQLAKLLNILGRRYEASPFLFQLLKLDRITIEELVLLCNRQPNYEVFEAYDLFRKAVPDDPRYLLNRARDLIYNEKPLEAAVILKQIIAADPSNIEARVWLGSGLWAAKDDAGFHEWRSQLPEATLEHPNYWEVMGQWAEDHGQIDAAKRCYWEALKRDPDLPIPNYRLAKLIGENPLAENFKKRADQWYDLEEDFLNVMQNRDHLRKESHEKRIRRIVELLEDQGRSWEALAWYRFFLKMDPTSESARAKEQQLKSQLTDATPRYPAESIIALRLDFSQNPLPVTLQQTPKQQPQTGLVVKFENISPQAGIDFKYFNAAEEGKNCALMYQVLGGGVAILDFDLDGFPDFYAVQGADWPWQPGQQRYVDRVHRNLGDGEFADVSVPARLAEDGFGQGVTVGDFNSDGFPDVYVANIGFNQLLQNNGDGTFSNVTESSQLNSDAWTSSCFMADLNGDGLPDIYEVNYLNDSDVFTRVCNTEYGPISCSPRVFHAAQDQIWLNVGDGTFQNVTAGSGIDVPDGKGLGVVAADIDNNGTLDIFVANDTTANFLFLNSSSGSAIAFKDIAAESGVNLSSRGLPQACMGIATTDLNADRRIDLFVTNFEKDSNTLYLSNGSGYEDATRTAGLVTPGFGYVGFGTQFLDADLDGDDDLLIANGHVQNLSKGGTPFEMPPLFLANQGDGTFVQAESLQVGPFFAESFLGRAMARLDWNRDGLADVLIASLDRPPALLNNRSKPLGSFISLRLIGTRSSRDAIGACVTLQADGKIQYRQLTAGDGYETSNQRELVFSVGDAEAVQKIEIRWPAGTTQTFEAVRSGGHYVVVEGSDEIVPTN